jgi:hypothetical protein
MKQKCKNCDKKCRKNLPRATKKATKSSVLLPFL